MCMDYLHVARLLQIQKPQTITGSLKAEDWEKKKIFAGNRAKGYMKRKYSLVIGCRQSHLQLIKNRF